MEEAEIRFEREEIEGVVPVGTYLIDAAKRFGLRDLECDIATREHVCAVSVVSGADLLSPVSDEEKKNIESAGDLGNGHTVRIACYAQIGSAGEIIVMTSEKAEKSAEEKAHHAEEYKKAFAELPLQQKLTNLMELESIALGETFSYVLNSPYVIADKFMDVLAGFGFQKEEAQKKASRPPFEETNGSDNGVSDNADNGSADETAKDAA